MAARQRHGSASAASIVRTIRKSRKVSSITLSSTACFYSNQLSSLLHDQQFNTAGLQEHEVKIRLTRFLFPKDDWTKLCRSLSGGEKMRLLLCCLMLSTQAPDLIVLDEPTNNLDLQNLDTLTAALDDYQGTLLIVSHDDYFLARLRVERSIELQR